MQVASLYEALHEARGLVPPPRGRVPFPEELPADRAGALTDGQALITAEFAEPADLDDLLRVTRKMRVALRAVVDDAEGKAVARERGVEQSLEPKLQARFLPALAMPTMSNMFCLCSCLSCHPAR